MSYEKRYGLEALMGCTPDRQGVQIAKSNVQHTAVLPFLSGVIGALNDKYLPLSLADDIRVEITFNTAALSGYWSTSATAVSSSSLSIISVEMITNIVELSDAAMSMVEQVSPFTQPIYMHATSWRSYISTLPASSSGQQSFLVPARFASLRSLVCCPRRSTEISGQNSYSISSRINPNIETYWWRVGSLMMPQKPVTLKNSSTTGAYSEGYLEVLRSWHAIGNFDITSALPLSYFNVADAADQKVTQYNTGSNSYKNGFAIAQELESISNRSDVLLSGINTLSQNTFFEFTNNTAIGSTQYTLNFFANYDMILILSADGLLSVKF